ncbi:MAG: NAD(P)/FAD-dependent oxidoreductase, partial [Patescibacteria group bacterium]
MTNILILGGGFGGISAALKLSRLLRNRGSSIPSESGEKKLSDIKITLVDRNNFHLFTPSLYEVATAYGLIQDKFTQYLKGSVAIPIGQILDGKKINFIQAEIKEINLKEKYILTNGGVKLDFDYLVIALGGETEFYGAPGAREYAYNFKGIDNVVGIYKKIKEIYKNYQKERTDRTIKIAIIGGGFTGVELASELSCCVGNIIKDYKLNKTCTIVFLFEAGPTILPAISEKARKIIERRIKDEMVQIQTNSPVVEIGSDYVKIKDRLKPVGPAQVGGEPLKFDLIIWAGGVRGSKLLENSGLKLTKKGTIEVNELLQTKNSDDSVNQKVFIIGDCGTYLDPKTQKPVPAMAYVAHDQADVAAENIVRSIKKQELIPYKPFYDAWIAPVGGKWAYFHYKGFNTAGFLGYLLKQLVDFRYFMKILPLNKALRLFFKDLVIFTRN